MIRCPFIRPSHCFSAQPWLARGNWIRYGTRVLCGLLGTRGDCGAHAAGPVVGFPRSGRYFPAAPHALNLSAYKPGCRLAIWKDLTIASFAYLRLPLFLAAIAFLVGAAEHIFAPPGNEHSLPRFLWLSCFFRQPVWPWPHSIRFFRHDPWRKRCAARRLEI